MNRPEIEHGVEARGRERKRCDVGERKIGVRQPAPRERDHPDVEIEPDDPAGAETLHHEPHRRAAATPDFESTPAGNRPAQPFQPARDASALQPGARGVVHGRATQSVQPHAGPITRRARVAGSPASAPLRPPRA